MRGLSKLKADRQRIISHYVSIALVVRERRRYVLGDGFRVTGIGYIWNMLVKVFRINGSDRYDITIDITKERVIYNEYGIFAFYDYTYDPNYIKLAKRLSSEKKPNFSFDVEGIHGFLYAQLNIFQRFRIYWMRGDTVIQRQVFQIVPIFISILAVLATIYPYYKTSTLDKELLEAKAKITELYARQRVLELRDSLEKVRR
ncbi:hypothetical protein CNR22_21875 [Sphingobacteriaceae bacterium]|nr:hypothetical protein CNR22_21875 [Sphingobacteriaceae bacterium]